MTWWWERWVGCYGSGAVGDGASRRELRGTGGGGCGVEAVG